VATSVKIALANALLVIAVALWLVAVRRGSARLAPAALYVPVAAYAAASLAAVLFSQDRWHSLWTTGDLLTLGLVPLTVSLLARTSHQLPAAGGDPPHPASFSRLGVLDVLRSTPPRPSGRKPHWARRLAALATKPGEKSRPDPDRWDRLLRALTAVAVLSSAVGVWQYLNGASDLGHRLRGLTNHYMTFSGWTLAVALLLVGDMVFHRDRRRLRWTAPAFVLCSAGLLLSYTRSSWVGLAAGLVLVAAVWRPRALWLYPVVALLLALLLPRPLIDRVVSIFDLTNDSNYDRLCMVVSGAQMVEDNPLFGVGLGMVERRYPVYRRDDAPRWRVPHLHNNLVQIAAERGLVGLAAYLAILVMFARHTWRALGRRPQPALPALAGCFLAVTGVTVAGFFEYNWGDAEVWIVTLVCLAAPFALAPEAP